MRLGGRREVKVDFRLVAATHRDLSADVQAGRFRQDLYYRLSVIPIHLPSLRERREDIAALTLHFLSRANQAHQRNVNLSAGALQLLAACDWPGNIRQLGNLVERLVLLTDKTLVTEAALQRFMQQSPVEPTAAHPACALASAPPVPGLALVRDYAPATSHAASTLQTALQAHGGNQSRAAQSLGLTVRQYAYRLRKSGLR